MKILSMICALILLALAATGAARMSLSGESSEAGQDAEGTWEGTLGSGANQLHLIVTLTKSSGGIYSGQLNSVDQKVILIVENGMLSGDAIRFEVARIDGVYEGVLNKERAEMTGTWTQRGVPPQPLNLKRTASTGPAEPAKTSQVNTRKPGGPPLDIVVPIEPRAFKADGKWHLVYELHVTNLSKWDCQLTRLGESHPLALEHASLLGEIISHRLRRGLIALSTIHIQARLTSFSDLG